MNHPPHHLVLLQRVAAALQTLREDVVFLGGITTGLYLTDPAAPEPPTTVDVDCAIEVSSRSEYYRLEEALRGYGFQHDMTPGAPICRWRYQDLIVDIMPAQEDILGFSNRWYRAGLAHRLPYPLPDGTQIHILPAPYFLATKLEAYFSRGQEDWMLSRDLEDIVAILNGRLELPAELAATDAPLRPFLCDALTQLFLQREGAIHISGHLPRADNHLRTRYILNLVSGFVRSPA